MKIEIAGRTYRSQEELKRRVLALHDEHASEPMPEEAREEWNALNERLSEFEARNERILELVHDPRHVEHGSDFGAGRPHEEQHQQGQLRSQALQANERETFIPEAAREHMERMLREADDPEGRLARYIVATADRNYYRAFAAWMRDPVAGGHEWTDKERQAVQKVRWLERTMQITAGGQGGFLLPCVGGYGCERPRPRRGALCGSSSTRCWPRRSRRPCLTAASVIRRRASSPTREPTRSEPRSRKPARPRALPCGARTI